jgi:hypothetical protein
MKLWVFLTNLIVIIWSQSLFAAMLPYTASEITEVSEHLLESLIVDSPEQVNANRMIIELTNLESGRTVRINKGQYRINAGAYELHAYYPDGDNSIDLQFKQFKKQIKVEKGHTFTINLPTLSRRTALVSYNFMTLAFQTGSLDGAYEVSDLRREHYDGLNQVNPYPETSALDNNELEALTRTGIAINMKHLYVNSSAMIFAEFFTDYDAKNSLNRSGFILGGGKYWAGISNVFWLSAGIGSESAEWNTVKLNNSSTVELTGATTTESLVLELGWINLSSKALLSAKVDALNSSMMINLGYAFGGRSHSYQDEAWAY